LPTNFAWNPSPDIGVDPQLLGIRTGERMMPRRR
jgi:hypothetical protein